MSSTRFRGRSAVKGQQGIALVVVLILLVVTAILGLAIMRSSAMQERMAANLRDRSLAFQAAEGALRFGQEVLAAGAWHNLNRAPAVGDDCVDGVCPSGSAPAWTAVPTDRYDSARIPEAPEYWIEYIGTGPNQLGGCDDPKNIINCVNPLYRVTARSRAEGRADVLVQATFISRIPE